MTGRDWPDAGENAGYHNRCIFCGETFTGHKRRVFCRLCISSEDAAKAGMVRRMNAMFAVLQQIEWSDRGDLFGPGRCPVCHGEKPRHKDVSGPHVSGARDHYRQPCPLAFALSQAAYEEPSDDAEVTRAFEDGSRFMRYKQPQLETGTALAMKRAKGDADA